MHLPGNAYVRPPELRWKWPDRRITRYRLWPVRLFLLYVALVAVFQPPVPANPYELMGALVGATLAVFLLSTVATRALSLPAEAVADTIYCTDCGEPALDTDTFCTGCGAALGPNEPTTTATRNCPGCGRPLDDGATTCSGCGTTLSTAAND